jgi:lysophospholipase L1-like esterase
MKLLHTLVLSLSLASVLLGAAPSVLAQAPAAPEKGGEKKKDPAFATVEDVAGLPRVLIIGDSISIGYTPAVREGLKGVANVHRIPTNGSSTVTGLKGMDEWLKTGGADKKWDVIHFNWGLHDLKPYKDGKMVAGGPIWVPVEEYEKNLHTLVQQMKKTGAKLIFATTTPVPVGAAPRETGLETKYNEAALRVMKEEGVAIDDLYTLAASKQAEIQLPRNVHFNGTGYKILGDQAAASIKKELDK